MALENLSKHANWLLPDEDLSPEEETKIALGEMLRDSTVHLTAPVLRHLIGSDLLDLTDLAQTLIPHLVRCVHCRVILRQALEIDEVPSDAPLSLFLKDVDEWARWQAAAQTATEAAQRLLLDQGIGYVYEREGIVYRRLPDGREERFTSTEASSK